MPAGLWRRGVSFIHCTDSWQKRGRIGDVGENVRDVAGNKIARVRTGIGCNSDLERTANAACSKSQAGQDDHGQERNGPEAAGLRRQGHGCG